MYSWPPDWTSVASATPDDATRSERPLLTVLLFSV